LRNIFVSTEVVVDPLDDTVGIAENSSGVAFCRGEEFRDEPMVFAIGDPDICEVNAEGVLLFVATSL
jgi:hypothetical protein